jgi:hypothetical protein
MKSLVFAILIILAPGLVAATLPADASFEVQTVGSNSNCGGFSPANKGATGVDLTYPTSSPTTFTSSLSAVGTTALTDSGAGFTNLMLGNCVNISGQGSYFITAFTSSSIVTVDRTLGTFATTSGVVGGALASLGATCLPGLPANSITVTAYVHIKAGSYSITSATPCINGGTYTSSGPPRYNQTAIGYTNTRFDYGGTRPVLQIAASTSGVTILNGPNVAYLSLDGNSNTTSRGVLSGTAIIYDNVFANFTNSAVASGNPTNGSVIAYNTATGCSTQPVFQGVTFQSAIYLYNEAYGNTATAFNGGMTFIKNIASGNSGATTDGFAITASGGAGNALTGNVAYGNGRHGFNVTGSAYVAYINNIAEGNGTSGTGYGFVGFSSGLGTIYLFLSNGTYNNQSGATLNMAQSISTGNVALTASPFVDAGSGNFALNAVAGAGAAMRAAGFPALFPRGTTSSYQDVGASQHKDLGGGSVVVGP